ncbi:MAG: phage tail protein [Deltaproteobacteria bacterium]|nr:phage tail protein [Deltaproteobacteria bacterium]
MNGSARLLDHLPGIYHPSGDLRELLLALESVLFEPDADALEVQITGIATLFDAEETRDDFLPWLAQWVALSHRIGLSLERQRRLVGNIVPLYAWRGTKRYLIELLKFYLPRDAEVRVDDQEFSGFRIGMAKVGADTWLERDRPFWFKVAIRVPRSGMDAEGSPQWQVEWQERARQVIELAKPAHTAYDLDWSVD